MPSKNYNLTLQRYVTDEEKIAFIKKDANIRNTIKYWKKHYPFKLQKDDYEDFKKISKKARRIYDILEFLKSYKKNRLPKNPTELEFYSKHYDTIKFAEPHLKYIRTLEPN